MCKNSSDHLTAFCCLPAGRAFLFALLGDRERGDRSISCAFEVSSDAQILKGGEHYVAASLSPESQQGVMPLASNLSASYPLLLSRGVDLLVD